MNRSFWIALILSSSACAGVMVTVAADNKRLSDRLVAKRPPAGQDQPRQSAAGAGKSNRTPPPALSSEAKTRRASAAVARFMASLVPAEGSRAAEIAKQAFPASESNVEAAGKRLMFWEKLPELVRALEGLSVEELLAVAADLPIAETSHLGTSSKWLCDTRVHLIMLAAEQDPMRVLQDEKMMEGMEDFAVLRCLARVDPAEAALLLPEIVPPKDVYHKVKRERLTAVLLGSDLDLGLRLFLESRESAPDKEDGLDSEAGGLGLGLTPLREETIPRLVEAMRKPEFETIRNDIVKTVLDHRLSERGVAAAERQAKAMRLTAAEIERYLDSVRDALLPTAPEAMVDWMSKALAVDQQSQRIPDAVVSWANEDIDAATTWLGKQQPSPVLDQAIARFATEASYLDPEAAANWANEIQDEQLREKTLRGLANR